MGGQGYGDMGMDMGDMDARGHGCEDMDMVGHGYVGTWLCGALRGRIRGPLGQGMAMGVVLPDLTFRVGMEAPRVPPAICAAHGVSCRY